MIDPYLSLSLTLPSIFLLNVVLYRFCFQWKSYRYSLFILFILLIILIITPSNHHYNHKFSSRFCCPYQSLFWILLPKQLTNQLDSLLMTPDGPVTVPSIHYLPNSSSPVSSLTTDIQCLEYLSFGSPEDWIDNTAIISYRSQTLIWVHKSYLEMSLKILIFLIIIAISFIGNYLILIVMIKFKNSRNCTNLFICNMAIADLMTTLFSAWTSLQENLFQNYTLGPVFCKIETSSKGKPFLYH